MRTFLAIAVLGGGVAHATVGSALRIADVAPDIPLIVVVLLALRRGPEFGCGAGFVAGVLQDAAPRGLLGVRALTKAGFCFLGGAPRGRVGGGPPPLPEARPLVLSLLAGAPRVLSLLPLPLP